MKVDKPFNVSKYFFINTFISICLFFLIYNFSFSAINPINKGRFFLDNRPTKLAGAESLSERSGRDAEKIEGNKVAKKDSCVCTGDKETFEYKTGKRDFLVLSSLVGPTTGGQGFAENVNAGQAGGANAQHQYSGKLAVLNCPMGKCKDAQEKKVMVQLKDEFGKNEDYCGDQIVKIGNKKLCRPKKGTYIATDTVKGKPIDFKCDTADGCKGGNLKGNANWLMNMFRNLPGV